MVYPLDTCFLHAYAQKFAAAACGRKQETKNQKVQGLKNLGPTTTGGGTPPAIRAASMAPAELGPAAAQADAQDAVGAPVVRAGTIHIMFRKNIIMNA